MNPQTRRDFLADVGKGMLTASVGTGLAAGIGLSTALAEGSDEALRFGRLEPLVELMQENTAEQMLPLVVERLARGTRMREIVAAAALANARTFGGEDYIGFHAFMALAPAFAMTKETPTARRALPVLKVLYRNVNQIQARGGRRSEVLHPIQTMPRTAANGGGGNRLRELARRGDLSGAEALFADIAARSASEAFNEVQALVQDDTDVHRVVLAYRAWDLLGLTGAEHAHTTLRQSVHYCVNAEKNRIAHGYPEPGIRSVLPKVLDRYPLVGRKPGLREADDRWIASLCNTLLESTGAQAADAVGAALAEGFSLESVGEALSLTATQQVLRDAGRTPAQVQPGKPLGSVHGDSSGVHASDSMNAWRNIAQASHPFNALTGLIVAAYHLASAQHQDWNHLTPYPLSEHRAEVQSLAPSILLRELEEAIYANNQGRATAVVQRYGELELPARPVFDLMLRFAISEDGSLHAEKYYRTVAEEFGRTRKAYRWAHVVALARVTASEYGKRADGYEQACGLLQVKA